MTRSRYSYAELHRPGGHGERDSVRAGVEVVIEHDARPVAIVRSAEPRPGCLLSESIALAEAHAKELGYEPTMDPDFAADLKEIINSRKPRLRCAWD